MKELIEKNQDNYVSMLAIIAGIVILFTILVLLFYTGTDSRETNEKLKKENYQLKIRIEKLEEEKLQCLLSK